MKKSNIKKIEVLEDYKDEHVYDITVGDNHNYFANNALVHNCIFIDESLAGETLLQCEDGIDRTIEDIVKNKLKIKIATFNLKTYEKEYSKILNYFEYPCSKKCLEIEYEIDSRTYKLQCTEDHFIFTKNNNYIEAKNLHEYQELLVGTIKKIIKIKRIETVYDIETINHNFFANNLLVHNSHKTSDIAVSNKILPMLGSFKRRQLIKAGVALYKNNFRESCLSPQDVVIMHDWLHCDILKTSGVIKYKGVEYPKSVVDLMPWTHKLQIFGDMAHKLGKGGKLSEIDFITQYQLIWQEQVGQYLSRAQQELLKSGTHKEITESDNVGLFFFGLDTASGTMRLDRDGLDDTALSIWRLFNGELQKVYCQAWQLQPLEEYQEILAVLKRFRPKFGYIDFSNTAIAFLDMLKRDGISCEGITYAMKDPISGKNNRQAMLDNFSSLLTLGKVKYPKIFGSDGKILVSPDMYKSYIQWTILQRKITSTSERIEAPDDDHDDFVFSDVQCVFATAKYFDFINTSTTTSSIPFAGSRGGMMSRNQR